jgi:hypothetical protein
MKRYGMLFSLLALSLLLAACGVGLSVNTDAEGNTILDVSLPETVVNEIIKGAVTSDNAGDVNAILNQIDSLDMKPGLISVAGKKTLADGTQVNGTFDVTLAAENGQLKASVSNVQMAGEPVSQETINQINERIASALAQSASSNDQAEINSVSITDTALQMVLTIKKQ